MSLAAVQPAGEGLLGAVKSFDAGALRRALVRDETGQHGHYRRGRERLLLRNKRESVWRQELLAWLRDHVHRGIPRLYYDAVLGHDLHISTYASLYVQHYHATQPDPFTGRMGWLEDVGRVSRGKVTIAFRDFQVDNLVTDTTAMGDFKHHEVGTSATAEANTDTALVTTTGIARAVGTQVEASAAVYRSVATVTADTTETWQEHGLFNASTGPTLLDRSLISPTVAVVNLDTVTFTYEVTLTAEA
jgi:hypothetical protein